MVLPGSLPSPVRQPLFVTSLKLLPRPPSSVVAALTIADRGQLRRRVIFRVHVTRREKRSRRVSGTWVVTLAAHPPFNHRVGVSLRCGGGVRASLTEPPPLNVRPACARRLVG